MTDASRQPIEIPTDLPPGVHPGDQSAPFVPGFDSNLPVAPDAAAPSQPTRRKPWGTMNERAMPVYQRSSYDWRPGLLFVTGTQPFIVVDRQAGRVAVALWVPQQVVGPGGVIIATPAGVQLGSEAAEATTMNVLLNVGDAITLPTEATVWAAVQPGQTVGYVQYATYVNPVGGELGIY
jgi:hypothetical protein